MNKIWIVFGNCGVYGDYTKWPVRAFKSRKRASEFKRLLKLQFEDLKERCEQIDPEQWYLHANKDLLPADRRFQTDYTGTDYQYEPVYLED